MGDSRLWLGCGATRSEFAPAEPIPGDQSRARGSAPRVRLSARGIGRGPMPESTRSREIAAADAGAESRSLDASRSPGDALVKGDIPGNCLDPVSMFFRALAAHLGFSLPVCANPRFQGTHGLFPVVCGSSRVGTSHSFNLVLPPGSSAYTGFPPESASHWRSGPLLNSARPCTSWRYGSGTNLEGVEGFGRGGVFKRWRAVRKTRLHTVPTYLIDGGQALSILAATRELGEHPNRSRRPPQRSCHV